MAKSVCMSILNLQNYLTDFNEIWYCGVYLTLQILVHTSKD
jgi:hypothetical protein